MPTDKKKVIQPKRNVVATMMKGQTKEVILRRHYAYFDTAMPRMVQMAINYGNEGDIVEFYSFDYGFQIGILRIKKGGKFEMEMSPLVRSSPTLLKLMSESNTDWNKGLVGAAMKKPLPEHSNHTRH